MPCKEGKSNANGCSWDSVKGEGPMQPLEVASNKERPGRRQGEKAPWHQRGDKDTNDVQWRGRKRAQLTAGNTALNLVCNHSDRDMKEAAERAANSVRLFRVDGQCLTSAKFGMRELGCRQKRTCFWWSGLKKVTSSPKQQTGWLRGLNCKMVLLDLLVPLGRAEKCIDSC